MSSWRYADVVFSWNCDTFGDGSKAWRFGFHGHIETRVMFTRLFDDFRRRRIIP